MGLAAGDNFGLGLCSTFMGALLFAFDVIETLFDPSPIDAAMVEIGLPAGSLKVWFPELLRDAFALEVIRE